MPATLSKPQAARRNPQELIFFGFLVSLVVSRIITLIRRRRKGIDAPVDGSVAVDADAAQVKKGLRQFSMTTDDSSSSGFGWSDALPYYLPSLVFSLECFQNITTGPIQPGKMWPMPRLKKELTLLFGILPLLECFTAHDWSNPKEDEAKKHPHKDPKFRFPLFWWTAVHLIFTYITIKNATDPKLPLRFRDRVAMILLNGIIGGALTINNAHELLHKKDTLGWLAGMACLTNVSYTHWGQEHLVGHHLNVATPEDPATSRKGESFYAFLPRTLRGSLASSWEIEKAKHGGGDRPLWWLTPRNSVLMGAGASLAWALGIARAAGRPASRVLPAFALHSFAAFSMLEAVNYLEHYALLRKRVPGGGYEAVDPTHSWNSPHKMSNILLFKLQRHSDHHAFATRPYELLRNFKESPQLPSGYPGMLLLAFIPPLWRWVMDPYADVVNGGGDVDAARCEAERKMRWVSGLSTAALLTWVVTDRTPLVPMDILTTMAR